MLDGQLGVMVYVGDLKESVEFFRDKLDFGFRGYWDNTTNSVVDSWDECEEPGYAQVSIGDDHVGLHPDANFEPGETRIKLNFYVDDVDAVYENAVSNGVDATEPQDFPWGSRMFTVTSPSGHKMDFLEEL